jgi:hypothetical protein
MANTSGRYAGLTAPDGKARLLSFSKSIICLEKLGFTPIAFRHL